MDNGDELQGPEAELEMKEEEYPLEIEESADSETMYFHDRMTKRLEAPIEAHVGEKERVKDAVIQERYYGELLIWALYRHIEVDGWKVVRTTGYYRSEAIYMDVNTNLRESRRLVQNGCLFLSRPGERIVVTIDANMRSYNSVVVTGPASRVKGVNEFVEGVKRIIKEENFYKGKKIGLGGRIGFLDIPDRDWDSLILEPEIKDEIHANTVGFIASLDVLRECGVPPRRGVLLAGEPGTGKTLICKVIMAQSPGITCIVTDPYAFDGNPDIREYVYELYGLAQDLAPSIVFIEDIDFFAQKRTEFGYVKGPALLSLLAVLDGIEEHDRIITVATTNSLEILDDAIRERPSRFDRVIQLTRPTLKQRKQFVSKLCRTVPLTDEIQDYIAHGTERFTPAQLQEVIYSLIIARNHNGRHADSGFSEFSTFEVDCAIRKICGRRHPLGFCPENNHNGQRLETIRISIKDGRQSQ